ncbi:MAG: NUDIX hydrolase [Candidatus Saccharibacteria bacterium]|nr:NUDIX hydrolase [Candidatus Saccharibacteria bacterium]
MKLKHIPAAYRVTVKGLVRDCQGRLLFVRERGGAWDLPGGGLEHGEEIFNALRREFREELRAEIDITAAPPIIIPTWHQKFDDPVLVIAYEVRLRNKPQTSSEVDEYAYMYPSDIPQGQLDSTLIDKLS